MTDGALPAAPKWLLFIHQLPPKPAYLRVKVWRRLQSIGAVAIKNSVYVLPADEDRQEDFEWLLREVVEGGGEAMVCEARLLDGFTDAQVIGIFRDAREADYRDIADQGRSLLDRFDAAGVEEAGQQIDRLRKRFGQLVSLDFFSAPGRAEVEQVLRELQGRATPGGGKTARPAADARLPKSLQGKRWVTRKGVKVDRIASAWLIRRFVDPTAKFKFVAGDRYVARRHEIRFDMFEAEFTHIGDQCTFEVLLQHVRAADPALRAVGEIVHDIDLKDGKFGREETTGIAHLITGMTLTCATDEERLARGAAILDELYEYFRATLG